MADFSNIKVGDKIKYYSRQALQNSNRRRKGGKR